MVRPEKVMLIPNSFLDFFLFLSEGMAYYTE